MKAPVYNLKNEVVSEIDLPEKIFGEKWRAALVSQVLRAQLANKRIPWAHAKTRAEVRGGGRKPWQQKGTGRARHGSTRSPLWVGGGKSHGPSKDRDYSQKVNKKMKKTALFSAISKKLKDGELKVFETLEPEIPKTKVLAGYLGPILKITRKNKKYNVLLVASDSNKKIFRASSNLTKAKATNARSLNVYDVLNYKNIFIEKQAISSVAENYKI